MSNVSSDKLLDVAADIDAELARLARLVEDAASVRRELESGREQPQWLHESLAFKQPYLGFRHVVHNIYGFELDANRLLKLVDDLPATHAAFQRDASVFVGWLRELAAKQ